ncbi:hypothetical protein MSAN_00719800 [Mycena sanguinolenta]|uniref:Nudix hydrolase domain-containing protein n=1 Tax=Mycena sanguinolenta TaxID=230812 RepID=A0A8H6Z5U1_9AGAR|nr:hypothetical protein MSAN_00719800 [Mycena sanguinolenta]
MQQYRVCCLVTHRLNSATMSRAFAQLSRPNWSSPIFSKPFTRNILKTIRELLDDSSRLELPSWASLDKKRNAAILIPFCNVQETPGILLQVRSLSMRSHSGEVSFPGGKVDALVDLSLLDTALRETSEEMNISKDTVELLGSIGPPEKSLRGDTVWPFVGFVHKHTERPSTNEDQPLYSIDLPALKRMASKDEVAAIFHLPLTELANPSRRRRYLFRGDRPYWAVEVSDLVSGEDGLPFISESVEKPFEDDIGAGQEGRLEVWGLTGWYLHLLSTKLALLDSQQVKL